MNEWGKAIPQDGAVYSTEEKQAKVLQDVGPIPNRFNELFGLLDSLHNEYSYLRDKLDPIYIPRDEASPNKEGPSPPAPARSKMESNLVDINGSLTGLLYKLVELRSGVQL